MTSLKKVETNNLWVFPDRICIEPRLENGSLDVKRIGQKGLSRDLGQVKTNNDLCVLFFKYHKDKHSVNCQEIANWLTDNGFMWRERNW